MFLLRHMVVEVDIGTSLCNIQNRQFCIDSSVLLYPNILPMYVVLYLHHTLSYKDIKIILAHPSHVLNIELCNINKKKE